MADADIIRPKAVWRVGFPIATALSIAALPLNPVAGLIAPLCTAGWFMAWTRTILQRGSVLVLRGFFDERGPNDRVDTSELVRAELGFLYPTWPTRILRLEDASGRSLELQPWFWTNARKLRDLRQCVHAGLDTSRRV